MPLYAQLAERLEGRIFDGTYQPKQRIPSEHQLAGEFEVGRPTVRQATELLVRRGMLERRRGSGTYVQERPAGVDLFSLGGTIVSFTRTGVELQTSLLEAAQPTTREGIPGFHFTRVGQVEGEPVLTEEFFVSAALFPHFDEIDLQGRSLSRAIYERYGLRPMSADQSFGAVLVDGPAAQALGVSPNSPILQVDRYIHFETMRNAVTVCMRCRTDRFRFSQSVGGAHA